MQWRHQDELVPGANERLTQRAPGGVGVFGEVVHGSAEAHRQSEQNVTEAETRLLSLRSQVEDAFALDEQVPLQDPAGWSLRRCPVLDCSVTAGRDEDAWRFLSYGKVRAPRLDLRR